MDHEYESLLEAERLLSTAFMATCSDKENPQSGRDLICSAHMHMTTRVKNSFTGRDTNG